MIFHGFPMDFPLFSAPKRCSTPPNAARFPLKVRPERQVVRGLHRVWRLHNLRGQQLQVACVWRPLGFHRFPIDFHGFSLIFLDFP